MSQNMIDLAQASAITLLAFALIFHITHGGHK